MMKPYQGNHQNGNHQNANHQNANHQNADYQDAKQDDEQDELFYNVKFIVASKHVGRKVKYRVWWEGYTEQDDTWETIENLCNAMQAVQDYYAVHPRTVHDPTV